MKGNFGETQRIREEYKSAVEIAEREFGYFDFCNLILKQGRNALEIGAIEKATRFPKEASKVLDDMVGRADHRLIAVALHEKARAAMH